MHGQTHSSAKVCLCPCLPYITTSCPSRASSSLLWDECPGQSNASKPIRIDRLVVFTARTGMESTFSNDITVQLNTTDMTRISGWGTFWHSPMFIRHPGGAYSKTVLSNDVSETSKMLTLVAVAGISIFILHLLVVLEVVHILRRRRRPRKKKMLSLTPTLPIQTPGSSGICPQSARVSKTEPFLGLRRMSVHLWIVCGGTFQRKND